MSAYRQLEPLVERMNRFSNVAVRDPVRAITILLRVAAIRLQLILARFGAHSETLASAYYLFASGAFKREHRAVLCGKLAFHSANIGLEASSPRLRRNIHRLEKGLIMRPRRQVFAEEYISQTVADYCEAKANDKFHDGEQSWALDVLSAYFACVGSSPRIDRARRKFEAAGPIATEPLLIPYPSQDRVRSDVRFDQLVKLFQQRRSTRWFDGRTVARELIERAVGAASLAPSACNRQPYYYAILDEPSRAQAIARLAGGTAGFADNIPCLIVAVGDLSCYPEERDRHLIYIDSSLANMQLMLALQTLGLSTCAINWPDVTSRDQAISDELTLSPHDRVVMLIAVGYAAPDGNIPFSQKKPSELLIR